MLTGLAGLGLGFFLGFNTAKGLYATEDDIENTKRKVKTLAGMAVGVALVTTVVAKVARS